MSAPTTASGGYGADSRPGRPRRHGPHAGPGRRRHPARARRGVPLGLRRAGRLRHAGVRRRRLGRARATGPRTDLYVFGYGRDYREAIQAFYAVSGPTPCCRGSPWATGGAATTGTPTTSTATWSTGSAPRASRSPSAFSTWTGTSSTSTRGTAAAGPATRWNPELFPDPRAVPGVAARPRPSRHAQRPSGRRRPRARGGLPGDGQGARAGPGGRDPIAFDVTDPAFLDAYFEVLHRSLEDDGVDFWWLDWQSGPALAGHRHRPAVDAEPLPLPGQRRRDGQPARSPSPATPGPAATATPSDSPATPW